MRRSGTVSHTQCWHLGELQVLQIWRATVRRVLWSVGLHVQCSSRCLSVRRKVQVCYFASLDLQRQPSNCPDHTVRTCFAIQRGPVSVCWPVRTSFFPQTESNHGGFAGVWTAATHASDKPGPPKTLSLARSLSRQKRSAPHSCRPRADATSH